MTPYGGKSELWFRMVYWSVVSFLVMVWLTSGSALFLATREVMATIEAPRCVLDPRSQVWRGPSL